MDLRSSDYSCYRDFMNLKWICSFGLALSFGTGCAHTLTPKEFESLEQGLVILEQSEDRVLKMFLAILAELDLGRSSSCREQAKQVGLAAPYQRAQLLAGAVETCASACPKELEAYDHLAPEEKQQKIIAECDATTPDLFFGPELADMRTSFLFDDYVHVRLFTDAFAQAIKNTNTPQADALWDQYRAYAKPVAAKLKENYELDKKERLEFKKKQLQQ